MLKHLRETLKNHEVLAETLAQVLDLTLSGMAHGCYKCESEVFVEFWLNWIQEVTQNNDCSQCTVVHNDIHLSFILF